MRINRKELLDSLKNTVAGLDNKELIEQSNAFIFKDGHVYTYNDEISAYSKVNLDIEGAVTAEPLLKLLNKVKDEEIDVEVEDDEIVIKGKKFKTGIKFSPEMKLPINSIDEKEFIKTPKNFSQLVKLACLTAGKSISDQILSCLHFCDNRVESCDSGRITICTFDKFNIKGDFLIQAKSMLEISKFNIIAVAHDEHWAYFKIDSGEGKDTVLSCRLYNDEYLDLDKYLTDEEDSREIVFPPEIEEIIGRADVFSLDKITNEKDAVIKLKKRGLTISTHNDTGWYTEKAKVKSEESLNFNINIDFLRDVLKLSDTISVADDVLMFKDKNSIHMIKLDLEESE